VGDLGPGWVAAGLGAPAGLAGSATDGQADVATRVARVEDPIAQVEGATPEAATPVMRVAEPVVRFEDLAVAYERRPALTGVHGEVHAGRAVAVIGPNGAGKTTLLKAVLGLVPVVAGRVTVLGSSPAQARRQVAYMPQADTLDGEFPVSVEQVVLMGRYRAVGWFRRPGRVDRRIAAEALDRVGLADLARRRFGVLSGGQRQRVLLARAMAQQPRLLLLDEPFSGVDVPSQQALLDGLAGMRAEGATVLLSTHDLALARNVCDVVCLLNRRQLGFGPVPQVLTRPLLLQAYGGQVLDLAEQCVAVPH
jgi:ABC-type Mn2+/Zn2+ transport system ATPase subunit